MRKLSAYLLAVFVSLTMLGWAARPAAAEVLPELEAETELTIPVDPAASPSAENIDQGVDGTDITVDEFEANAVDSHPGVIGRIRAWLSTHGLATVKGAGVGLAVGGLIAVGAIAFGLLGAPALLVVGAGVLGGALYGASVGNANFNWFTAASAAALGSLTVLIGGLAAGVGRAVSPGAATVGEGLFGSLARATVAPGADDVHDAYCAITGYDPILGQKLDWVDRLVSVASIIVPAATGSELRATVRAVRAGDKAAAATLKSTLRSSLSQVDDAGIDRLVEFITWADTQFQKRVPKQAGELAQKTGSDLVTGWLKELEPTEVAQLVKRYRYNPHLLGALNESRAAAQLRKLEEKGEVVLLHTNGRVNQGGADLIWYDVKSGRIVFADVKASVSGATISSVKTFQKRMKKNIETAKRIINKSSTLTQGEKNRLIEALDDGEFDVQVILVGNAKGSSKLTEHLAASIQRIYAKTGVREFMRLDP